MLPVCVGRPIVKLPAVTLPKFVFTSPNSMVLVKTLGAKAKAPVPALMLAPLGLSVSVKKLIGPLPVVAIVVPPVRLIVGASTVIPAPAALLVALPPNVMAPPVEVKVVA